MSYIHVNTHNTTKTPMGPGGRFFFGRIFPLIFFFIGLGLYWKGTNDMELAKESVNWPSVEGQIVSSEVVRKTSRDSNKRTSTTFHAEVWYDYSIGGKQYSADKISFGDYGSSNRGHARGIVNIYKPGKKVQVYYKPDEPSYAVLETGMKGGTWIMPIVGGVFTVIGVVLFWVLPGQMNKRREQFEQTQNG